MIPDNYAGAWPQGCLSLKAFDNILPGKTSPSLPPTTKRKDGKRISKRLSIIVNTAHKSHVLHTQMDHNPAPPGRDVHPGPRAHPNPNQPQVSPILRVPPPQSEDLRLRTAASGRGYNVCGPYRLADYNRCRGGMSVQYFRSTGINIGRY